MDIVSVNVHELGNVLQYVSLVNVKFGWSDTWIATPVFFASLDSIDVLIDLKKSRYIIEYGEKVVLKFQKMGYEYILHGEIFEVSVCDPATATIKLIDGRRYFNQRRHVRYETELPMVLHAQEGIRGESIGKNISEGGAMFLFDKNIVIGSLIELEVDFGNLGLFRSKGKVLRKIWYDSAYFSYGVQFVDISEENEQVLRRGLSEYEKKYFKSLDELRGVKSHGLQRYETVICIFSVSNRENYDIGENLVKLGAGNFTVFHDFKFYVDYFTEEKPKLAIIEADSIDEKIAQGIMALHSGFPDVKIVIILPVQEMCKSSTEVLDLPELDIFYKPLIYNEFEEKIIKYL